MKKITAFLVAVLGAAALTGCQATKSVVTEYDSEGKIVKVTETGESVVKNITDSTKNKTVVGWESGWAAYISASTATTEDPTPTFKMFAGKTDKGAISALPQQQDWDGIARTITATKYELTVSADGVGNTSVTAEPAKPEVKTVNVEVQKDVTISPTEKSGTSEKTETAASQTAEKQESAAQPAAAAETSQADKVTVTEDNAVK